MRSAPALIAALESAIPEETRLCQRLPMTEGLVVLRSRSRYTATIRDAEGEERVRRWSRALGSCVGDLSACVVVLQSLRPGYRCGSLSFESAACPPNGEMSERPLHSPEAAYELLERPNAARVASAKTKTVTYDVPTTRRLKSAAIDAGRLGPDHQHDERRAEGLCARSKAEDASAQSEISRCDVSSAIELPCAPDLCGAQSRVRQASIERSSAPL